MVVQVNGKVRDRIEVDAGISEGDAEAAALASAKVIDALGGRRAEAGRGPPAAPGQRRRLSNRPLSRPVSRLAGTVDLTG
jgi:hypothetical protein